MPASTIIEAWQPLDSPLSGSCARAQVLSRRPARGNEVLIKEKRGKNTQKPVRKKKTCQERALQYAV